jgi:5-methylcytosine-specific restriction endonuclease McrA
MTAIPKWGGRRAQEWKAAVLARYGHVCHLQLRGCTRVATQADHVIPRSVRLDLQYDVDNGRPACEPCNKRRKAKPLDARPVVDNRQFFESAPPSRKDCGGSPPREPRKNGRKEART